jgi:hypothetical protein
MNTTDHPLANTGKWWFDNYYQVVNYNKLDKIGLDINFNKHVNHGIEFRIFDYFPENKIADLLKFLIHIFDFSRENDLPKAIEHELWNKLMLNIIVNGGNYKIDVPVAKQLSKLFGFYYVGKVNDYFARFMDFICELYKDGLYSKTMIK